MRSITVFTLALVILVGGLAWAQEPLSLDQMEQKLRAGSTEDLRAYTRTLRQTSGEKVRHIDSARTELEVYVDHHRTLMRETFYHLEKIAPYHRYEDALKLKKLKALRDNRLHYEEGEISEESYRRNAEKIKHQYEKDLRETREFLASKIDRLRELCEALKDNVRAMEDVSEKGKIPRWVKERILALKESETWVAFSTPTPRGQNMREVLINSPGGGRGLVACLEEIFTPFEDTSATVFSPEVIENVVSQYE